MDKNNLLSTKLKLPQPRRNYIVRQGLFDRLEQMRDCRLTVIKGGAGSGKTTLITSFIKEKALSNVRWVALDEGCNNLLLFWNYIIEATADLLGDAKQVFVAFFNANVSPSSMEQMLGLYINSFNSEQEAFLILDDFHCITDRQLLDGFEFFITNAPDNLHFILLTRAEPLFYLAGLGMDGSLLLLDEKDLTLSPEEAERFLKKTLALPYSPEALRYMARLAEGWIGGLQLVASAAQGKNEAEIIRLKLTSRLISEYLTKEIFERLSEGEQRFLVNTSPFSYFCKEVCTALFEGCDYERMMESFQQKNLLILCIDEERGLYRYHNILGEYLKMRFARQDEPLKTALLAKAAAAFEALGDYDESLRQLLTLEDYTAAMRLILEMPKTAGTLSYLTAVPMRFATENFDFAYQRLFYHYSNIEYDKCQELYDLMMLKRGDDPALEAFTGMKFIIGSGVADFSMEVMTAEEIDRLNLNCVTKSLIMVKNASLLYYQNRYTEALKLIAKATNCLQSASNPYIAFFAFSVKAQIHEDLGNLKFALSIYEQTQEYIQQHKHMSLFYPSYYIGITGTYLKQLNLEKAIECLNKSTLHTVKRQNWFDVGYAYNLAEYRYLTGDKEGGLELYRRLSALETYQNILTLATLLKYLLKYGQLDGASMDKFKADYKGASENNRCLDSKLMYARILAAENNTTEALALADEVLQHSRKNEVYLKLIEASLFKISLLLHSGAAPRELLNLFKEALYYAHENTVLLPFVFEQEAVLGIDRQFAAALGADLSEPERAFYKEVLKSCGAEEPCILSNRELEVLRQLAGGLANKEIALNLCISLATVKTHILNIYGKLGVNARVAAIDAAKKAGLI